MDGLARFLGGASGFAPTRPAPTVHELLAMRGNPMGLTPWLQPWMQHRPESPWDLLGLERFGLTMPRRYDPPYRQRPGETPPFVPVGLPENDLSRFVRWLGQMQSF